jgi:hypothetical protein
MERTRARTAETKAWGSPAVRHDQIDVGPGPLRERDINFKADVGGHTEVAHVAEHADHFQRLRDTAQQDVLADRIFVGPVAARQRLVDHGDQGRVGIVALRELTAARHGDAQSGGVTGPRHLKIDHSPLRQR